MGLWCCLFICPPLSVFPGGVCDTRCRGAGGVLIFKTASSKFSPRCPGLQTHLQIPPQAKTVWVFLFVFLNPIPNLILTCVTPSPSPTQPVRPSLVFSRCTARLLFSWNIYKPRSPPLPPAHLSVCKSHLTRLCCTSGFCNGLKKHGDVLCVCALWCVCVVLSV